jgi:hypothetical protein
MTSIIKQVVFSIQLDRMSIQVPTLYGVGMWQVHSSSLFWNNMAVFTTPLVRHPHLMQGSVLQPKLNGWLTLVSE